MSKKHTFILPHENTDKFFNSKDFLKNDCDLVVAEVSYPTTGSGIELGWADIFNIPILCLYRQGSKPSKSLKAITKNIIEYKNKQELISAIKKYLDSK